MSTPGDPEPATLWLTDEPALNSQTRNKMRQTSNVLTGPDLAAVDSAIDSEDLSPGRVYFLNIQKATFASTRCGTYLPTE